MAYFVSKVLHMRPLEILNEWCPEELLVAFAYYANLNSKQNYEMLSEKERRKERMTYLDKWAVKFVTTEQLKQINQEQENAEEVLNDQERISQTLFG